MKTTLPVALLLFSLSLPGFGSQEPEATPVLPNDYLESKLLDKIILKYNSANCGSSSSNADIRLDITAEVNWVVDTTAKKPKQKKEKFEIRDGAKIVKVKAGTFETFKSEIRISVGEIAQNVRKLLQTPILHRGSNKLTPPEHAQIQSIDLVIRAYDDGFWDNDTISRIKLTWNDLENTADSGSMELVHHSASDGVSLEGEIYYVPFGALDDAPTVAYDGPRAILLVRHAEKGFDGNDPDLTQEGMVRAEKLAHNLEKIKIDAVFATEMKRTQQTIAPTCRLQGLQPNIIPRDNYAQLAGILRSEVYRGKIVLVASHSDVIPDLSRKLGFADSLHVGDYDEFFFIEFTSGRPVVLNFQY